MSTVKSESFELSRNAIERINHIINVHNSDERNSQQVRLNTGEEMRSLLGMCRASEELFQVSGASSLIVDMFGPISAFILGESVGVFEKHYNNEELQKLSEIKDIDNEVERVTINANEIREKLFSFRIIATFLSDMESHYRSLQFHMRK